MLTAGQRRAFWVFSFLKPGQNGVHLGCEIPSWQANKIHQLRGGWNTMEERQRFKRTRGLVGGFNPFEKYWSNWKSSPNGSENKNLWNHHPEEHLIIAWYHWNCLHLWKVMQVMHFLANVTRFLRITTNGQPWDDHGDIISLSSLHPHRNFDLRHPLSNGSPLFFNNSVQPKWWNYTESLKPFQYLLESLVNVIMWF